MDFSNNTIFLGMIFAAVLGILFSLWAWSKDSGSSLIELNSHDQ